MSVTIFDAKEYIETLDGKGLTKLEICALFGLLETSAIVPDSIVGLRPDQRLSADKIKEVLKRAQEHAARTDIVKAREHAYLVETMTAAVAAGIRLAIRQKRPANQETSPEAVTPNVSFGSEKSPTAASDATDSGKPRHAENIEGATTAQ